MMNQSTKLYIYGVVACGILATGTSLFQLQMTNPALFALLAALAAFGGSLKMRVPGIDGNLSLSFVPMMLAAVLLSLPEAFLLAIMGTLVQATAFVKKRNPVKIAFNCSVLGLSTLAGYFAGQLVAGQNVPLVQLTLTAGAFYIVNSVLISTVLGLVENKPILEIWNECLHLYLPFFASGVACALMVLTGTTADERRTLQYPGIALMPLLLLVRQYFRHHSSSHSTQGA